MEVIGFAASLIALINFTTVIAKTTTTLCCNIHDSPNELASLRVRLTILQAELEALRYLTNAELDRILPVELRSSLLSTLHLGHGALEEILRLLKKSSGTNGVRGRLRWSMLDRSLVTKHLERLRDVEGSLGLLLQVVTANGLTRMLVEQENIKALQTRIFWPEKDIKLTDSAREKTVKRQRTFGSNRFISSHEPYHLLKTFGADGSVVCSTSDSSTVYSFSIRYHIPFANIFGGKILAMDFSMKSFSLCRSISVQDNSTLAIRTVVPYDADIMKACVQGNLQLVTHLFASGKARPDDVTPSNSTPLQFAIESGNVELVKFLLDNGPGVNRSFGIYQTWVLFQSSKIRRYDRGADPRPRSPLAWALQRKEYDVVCLLLRYGANLDHMGIMSWTPLFYCWPWLKASQVPMSNFISAMAQIDDVGVNVTDRWDWTVLHRAAAFGTADDVEILISLGASIHASTLPLRWNAIFHAVEYGNFGTFSVLLRHFDPLILIQATDERGWTLLHIAASGGQNQIVRHLLSLGADPYAVSRPFTSHVPESLLDRRCTPEDVAEAQSAERRERYLQAVREAGVMKPLSSVIMAEENFFDAEEGLDPD